MNKLNLSQILQEQILALFLQHRSYLIKYSSHIQSSHFDSKYHQEIIESILLFFSEYKEIPSKDILTNSVLQKVDEYEDYYTELIEYLYVVVIDNVPFLEKELKDFLRVQACKLAVAESAKKINENKPLDNLPTLFHHALKVGETLDYLPNAAFYTPKNVKAELGALRGEVLPTGLLNLDLLIGGGVGKKEILTVVGKQNSGKTTFAMQLGFNFSIQGFSGLHITMEMSEQVLRAKYWANLSELSVSEMKTESGYLKDCLDYYQEEYKSNIFIKEFYENTVTIDEIHSYTEDLIEFHGFHFDFVILDYIDLCKRPDSQDGDHKNLANMTRDYRKMCRQLNLVGVNISQANRSGAMSDEIDDIHVATSYETVAVSDISLSVNSNKDEYRCNQARLFILKNRFGKRDETIPVTFDGRLGRFTDTQAKAEEIIDVNTGEVITLKQPFRNR